MEIIADEMLRNILNAQNGSEIVENSTCDQPPQSLEQQAIDAQELELREEITSSPYPKPDNKEFELEERTENQELANNEQQLNASLNAENDDTNAKQLKEEMMKIILTRSDLKNLSECDVATFRRAATGFFVRVHLPDLPTPYEDRIFIDQIVDILEPQSYQHLWLNYRLRLRNLGDFEINKVIDLKVEQESDLRSWFDYLEAKDESLPTLEFIEKKKSDLSFAIQELEIINRKAMENNNGQRPDLKVQISRENLSQITLNSITLRTLSRLEFEQFKNVVVGCFVCMPAIRRDKPKNCQYHIIRIRDCVRGSRHYRLRKTARTDYQLILPFYGKYKINWVKDISLITDQGFRFCIDDMKLWKEQIPNLSEIREKAAEVQLALNVAQQILADRDIEKQTEEQKKHAQMAVQSVKDLEPCVLSRQQLQNLAQLDDFNLLSKTLTGCFVRLNIDGGKISEIDQIVGVDVNNELKGMLTEQEQKKKKGKAVLELRNAGTISLTPLTYMTSTLKATETEFKDFVRKMKNDGEEQSIPTYEFIEKKKTEIADALQLVNKEKKIEVNDKKLTVVESKSNNKEATSQNIHEQQKESFSTPVSSTKVKNMEEKPVKTFLTLPTKDGQLTAVEMRKVLISLTRMGDLMTGNKGTLANVVQGLYARIASKREDKSSALQYYVDQVIGVSWGDQPYKIRGTVITNIRLHYKHLGVRPLYDLYRSSENFNDNALQLFADDMKKWKQNLPTLAFINKKYRELLVATTRKLGRNMKMPPIGGAFLGSENAKYQVNTQSNVEFNQIQQLLQKQVASSVRTTPGIMAMDQSWVSTASPVKFQQQQIAVTPTLSNDNGVGIGVWSQQPTGYTFSTPLGKRHFADDSADMIHQHEQGNWRMEPLGRESGVSEYEQYRQEQLNRLHRAQNAEKINDIISLRDVPTNSATRVDRMHNYRHSYESDQSGVAVDAYRRLSAGGPSASRDMVVMPSELSTPFVASPLEHYNTYIPPAYKRSRQSPQPPPIERFY